MHYASVLSVVATASYLASANPVAISERSTPKHASAAHIKQLDSNGKLNWTTTDNGGRMTFLADDDFDTGRTHSAPGAAAIRSLNKRTSWGDWFQTGQKDGIQTWAQCITSGAWGIANTLDQYANKACKDITANTALGAAGNKGWQIWQGTGFDDTNPDDDAENSKTVYRFRKDGGNPPELTDELCEWAFEQLTTVACAGTGTHADASEGGDFQIGDDDSGSLHFGVDTNEDD